MLFRKIIACFLITILLSVRSAAQEDITNTKNISRIKLINGKEIKGYIVAVSDSSIGVITKKNYKKLQYSRRETIDAENISGITKNFKNGLTAVKGALGGAAVGVGVGIYIALKDTCVDSNQDGHCDPGTGQSFSEGLSKSVLFGTVLGSGGALVGLFSKKKDRKHFIINGDRKNVQNNKIGLGF